MFVWQLCSSLTTIKKDLFWIHNTSSSCCFLSERLNDRSNRRVPKSSAHPIYGYQTGTATGSKPSGNPAGGGGDDVLTRWRLRRKLGEGQGQGHHHDNNNHMGGNSTAVDTLKTSGNLVSWIMIVFVFVCSIFCIYSTFHFIYFMCVMHGWHFNFYGWLMIILAHLCL